LVVRPIGRGAFSSSVKGNRKDSWRYEKSLCRHE
jgi:hypothetical protein